MTAQPDQKDQPDQPEDEPEDLLLPDQPEDLLLPDQPEDLLLPDQLDLPDQPVVSHRAAFPGAPPSAPSFEEEIDTATKYERSLVGKALLAIAVCVLIVAIRAFFSG
jgi:hypothetical protein